MSVWSSEIKELGSLYSSIKGLFPELEKELDQLLKFDDANVVLLYSRRCLEVIIADLCESELNRPRKTEPLKGIIDKLHHEEKVPAHIIASMHGLNDLSTFGAHPKEFDPEQVRPVLNNLTIIIKWYLKYKNVEIIDVPEIVEKEKESGSIEKEKPVPERNQKAGIQPEEAIPKIKGKPLSRNPVVWATSFVVFITLVIVVFQIFYRSKVRWANEKAIPEIEQRVNELNLSAAFNLIKEAERYISKNKELEELAAIATSKVTFLTDPSGAKVFIREYSDSLGKWKKLGTTPIDSIELPSWSFYLTRIEKPGFEDVMAVTSTAPDTFSRKLFPEGTIPPGMIYIDVYWDEVKNVLLKDSCGFFMDRYEVTNKQYKEFVDNGGYRKKEYWKYEFIKDGKSITWEEAMREFTDKTGRPGPANWEGSDFPQGQADYPVSGISWYEAAAYAEYAGKDLPTADHWDSGAVLYSNSIVNGFGSKIKPLSNFNGRSAEPVGKNRGMNSFGAFDMAGNVREWCWNETETGRIVCGGGYDDADYMYSQWSQLPPFDRSIKNGFRCVKYLNKDKIPVTAFRKIEMGGGERDFTIETPVKDDVFKIYKNQFLYDKTDLNSIIEKIDSSNENWIIEKITFDAAYENERVIAYLYLPRHAKPPFQTLIWFPGSYGVWEKDLTSSRNSLWFGDYIIKNGLAMMFPVYKGTYERNDGLTIDMHGANPSHQYTEWLVKWTKDFSRSIDYLETRPDIDINKIGFLGHSWGGYIGGIIPAVESRIKIDILVVGGFWVWNKPLPEADMLNYVPRIKMPVLMLNGKYDAVFPLDKAVKPFFNLLGTPEKDKYLFVYETDHYVPKSEMIKETLNFLDKYWGPPDVHN
jgi:dienelactone hydrolase